MANYLINKGHHDKKIVAASDCTGYKFHPHITDDKFIKVKDVTVVDKDMIDKILTVKFNKSFRDLVRLAMSVLNDDEADDSDCEIVLDEIELVRQILLNRYQEFLSYEKEQLFLKKLRVIENELRNKQVREKEKAIYLENLEKGKGRSL